MTSKGSGFLGKDTKFVGGYLPRQMVEHLSLLALAENDSRTNLLWLALHTLLEGVTTVEELILNAANIALTKYQTVPHLKKMDIASYLHFLSNALLKKKIAPEHISQILTKVEEREKNKEAPSKNK